MKKWCIWCEMGEEANQKGELREYLWIHPTCFDSVADLKSDFDEVKKLLEAGKSYKEINAFLERAEDFRRRWNNTIKKLRGV